MSATTTRRTGVSRRASADAALNGPPATRPGIRCIRCAIYTRKSTEEGLDQEFNSLDAQRESAVAYIASQKNEGWSSVPDRYDDGGFTGGNMDRPALKRLMDDIEAGKVNCVVVYKVDRLSRSLMDFARLMELFDRKGVSFVSVTQQFNTTHSMGRLTLNILLSFAQFEREIISERTRDKIASARRKGKYQHGKPILGYDFVPAPAPFTGRRLVVNKEEAGRVLRIFELYLEAGSILRVADECNSRGWTTKSWTTTAGRTVGNREFDKTIISRMLRNPLYLGKVPHNGAVYDGEHEAIIDGDLFRRVQSQLKLAGARGGASVKNSTGSLLGGLVRCKGCGCAMSPSSASKKKTDGTRTRYRYYVCSNAVKRGRQHCAAPSLPGPALASGGGAGARLHGHSREGRVADRPGLRHGAGRAGGHAARSAAVPGEHPVLRRRALRRVRLDRAGGAAGPGAAAHLAAHQALRGHGGEPGDGRAGCEAAEVAPAALRPRRHGRVCHRAGRRPRRRGGCAGAGLTRPITRP
ncbi:recombinase family protein [Leptolyngbya sp. 15MV]|nr:recombinase family protein [Leptolyngbya sp. 15MV]